MVYSSDRWSTSAKETNFVIRVANLALDYFASCRGQADAQKRHPFAMKLQFSGKANVVKCVQGGFFWRPERLSRAMIGVL